MNVAFRGERGAYSEEAVRRLFGDVEVLPCARFADVFEAVRERRADAGLVPVENSHAGSVVDNHDLLQSGGLCVTGEVELRIRHCLLAPRGVGLASIRRVRSHPQALAQCDEFIRQQKLEAVADYDTAGSAKLVAERKPTDEASIASAGAAAIYGLEVLAESIETNRNNFTRFVSIGLRPAARRDPSKTSIVLGTENRPGALCRALGVFARRSINVTKLESRPSRRVPWGAHLPSRLRGPPRRRGRRGRPEGARSRERAGDGARLLPGVDEGLNLTCGCGRTGDVPAPGAPNGLRPGRARAMGRPGRRGARAPRPAGATPRGADRGSC